MNALLLCIGLLSAILFVYAVYVLHHVEGTLNRIHGAVLRGHFLEGEQSADLHRVEAKVDETVEKVRYLRLFAEEFTWRLVHFTDEELMELAKGEAWRQERIERDKGNTPQPRTEGYGESG